MRLTRVTAAVLLGVFLAVPMIPMLILPAKTTRSPGWGPTRVDEATGSCLLRPPSEQQGWLRSLMVEKCGGRVCTLSG